MDGTAGHQVDEAARIREIQQYMPQTYQAIKAMAANVGNSAFAAVRESVRGRPNRFYAIEGGYVVGTPFDMPDVTADLAKLIVQFGVQHLIIWAPDVVKGAGDGAH